MSRRNDDLNARLREMRAPELPADLKRRIMAAARLKPATSFVDRVWFSRAWRLTVLGTLLAAFALDYWTAGLIARPDASPALAAVSEASDVAQVGAEMGMPADMMRQLAARLESARPTARKPLDLDDPALR